MRWFVGGPDQRPALPGPAEALLARAAGLHGGARPAPCQAALRCGGMFSRSKTCRLHMPAITLSCSAVCLRSSAFSCSSVRSRQRSNQLKAGPCRSALVLVEAAQLRLGLGAARQHRQGAHALLVHAHPRLPPPGRVHGELQLEREFAQLLVYALQRVRHRQHLVQELLPEVLLVKFLKLLE